MEAYFSLNQQYPFSELVGEVNNVVTIRFRSMWKNYSKNYIQFIALTENLQ